jgi:hypothetical protein
LPGIIDWFKGLTVTEVTVGITTLTAVKADFVGSKTEVATTKRVGKVSFADIKSIPFAFIVVPGVTTPVPELFELTLHVTAPSGSCVPITSALNWYDLPADNV